MNKPTLPRRITDLNPGENALHRSVRATLDLQTTLAESCQTCPKPLWFTAFFDGTGNNYEEDGNGETDPAAVKYSNIAKLARFAHAKKGTRPRTDFAYAQGVGTPFLKIGDTGKGIDGALGMAAAAKGAARIEFMFKQLEAFVNPKMPFVNQINIAVFGFSRGATQARAFVRMLGEKLADWNGSELLWKQPGLNGKRPVVVVYFVGLFDTVSSTGFGGGKSETVAKYAVPATLNAVPGVGFFLGSLAGGVLRGLDKGGHAEWAHDLAIPPYVRRCVHYIAGHEVREKFPSDSIRRNQTLPDNSVEWVFPGMHSDVGGGYAASTPAYQEGRSNELARIPLNMMYIEAYKAGVPLDEPAAVMARAGALFDISPELERTYRNYMSAEPDWVRNSLETGIVWHMNRYYEWRESRRRRMKDGRLKVAVADPYMAITDAEWESDVLAIASDQTGYFRSAVGVQKSAIFDAYKHKAMDTMAPQVRADFDLFFDKYVHDSIAGFKKQMREASAAVALTELSRWSINRKYFVGKRDGRFMYWRYESDGTAYADVKFDDTNVNENYDSDEAKRARQGAIEAREFSRTR